jgi:hypothetical protein
MEAVLLSLEGRINDGEVNDISLWCDDVSELDLFGIHVKIVASESHLGRNICALGVPQEVEGLEVKGISTIDVGSLVGGVNVTCHIVVASMHHEGVVACVEFSVGSISDFHNIEFRILFLI